MGGSSPGTSSSDGIETMVCCPACGKVGGFTFSHIGEIQNNLRCPACGLKVPARDGILDFASHVTPTAVGSVPAQNLMNTRLFARIYDGPIWRPLHTRLGAGISLGEEMKDVLSLLGNRRPQRILDLACGTGYYARAFAGAFPEAAVLGVDMSFSMLERGQQLARKEGVRSVTFIRGDIFQLPVADNSVDHVNCAGALHLFQDLRPLWQEVSRVLKPEGVFTGVGIGGNADYGTMRKLLERARKKPLLHPARITEEMAACEMVDFHTIQRRFEMIFSAVRAQSARRLYVA